MTLSEMINIYDSESAISQSFIHRYYELVTDQCPVSQKSRKFSGLFRVPQFPLYLRNAEVPSHQTSQSS